METRWPLPSHYVLFHKPFRVLSQFSSSGGKATLRDFIPLPGIYPVGRLDYDSEGLLLLTDNGALQHRLTDPRFEHPRVYWAQVEGVITDVAVKQLKSGVKIADYTTRPCQAEVISEPDLPPRDPPIRYRKNIPTSWLSLTLTEGRNRQVRRMTAAVGYPTLRLVRAVIGELTLDELLPGRWRYLTKGEIRNLETLL